MIRQRRFGARTAAATVMAVLLFPVPALANGDTYQLDNTGGTNTTPGSSTGFVFGGTNSASDADTITIVEDGSSINLDNGMLERPYYFNLDSGRYFSLTYLPPENIIPLSVAVGLGAGGGLWHGNTHVTASQIDNSRGTADVNATFSGAFTGSGNFSITASTIAGTGHRRGPGSITTVGTVTLNSIDLEITHVYTLLANTKFVKVDTSVKNTSGNGASNVNMWVGTSDDWIGGESGSYDGPGGDSPTKYKGLVSGTGANSSFRAVCSGPTNAVLVYSTDEYVLMYGANAQAVLSDEINQFDSTLNDINFDRALVDIEPGESEYVIEENDGSYGLYLPFGDIAAGQTSAVNTWYFEGGELGFTPQDCNATVSTVVSRLRLECTPDPVAPGALVTCEVTGGDPGIDILWEADLGGVFATAGVALDANGRGTFTFRAPVGAAGRSIAVRLVDWSVTDAVLVTGDAIPNRLPAGGGPSGPAPGVLVAGLMLATGLGVARLRRGAASL